MIARKTVSMTFKELSIFDQQLNVQEKLPIWYAMGRTKAATEKLCEAVKKDFDKEKMVIIERLGKKDENGKWKEKPSTDPMGRPAMTVDFEEDQAEGDRLFQELQNETFEKVHEVTVFLPNQKLIEDTLKLTLSPANLHLVIEHMLGDAETAPQEASTA